MIENVQSRPSAEAIANDALADRRSGGYTARPGPSKSARAVRDLTRKLAAFVYPSLCPSCRTEIAEDGGLCSACWRETTFISGACCRICAAPVSPGLGEDAVCDGCAHAPPAWSRGGAAVVYEGAGRKLVLGLKHGDRLDVAALAALWMARASPTLIAEADVIAPVPLHWRRMIRRRYNQAGEIARELASRMGGEERLVLDLLRRTRRAETQDGKTRAERFANAESIFAVARKARALDGRSVLLIDDVMTTGATLSSCAEACRAAGAADVNVLVFARVARADWPT